MQEQRTFTLQSIFLVLVLNGLILGAIWFYSQEQPLAIGTPLFNQLAIGAGATLLLWLLLMLLGRRLIAAAARSAIASMPAPERTAPEPVAAPIREPVLPPAPVIEQPSRAESIDAGAVQMLALLQRQGRLVDFLQEDLTPYEDAQIGAAVRPIHQGCKQALQQHVQLEPVFGESEGSRVTVQPGFDAYAIRLSGNVVGNPPFSGALQHRGWRVKALNLPSQTPEQEASRVVAAAEVEVGA